MLTTSNLRKLVIVGLIGLFASILLFGEILSSPPSVPPPSSSSSSSSSSPSSSSVSSSLTTKSTLVEVEDLREEALTVTLQEAILEDDRETHTQLHEMKTTETSTSTSTTEVTSTIEVTSTTSTTETTPNNIPYQNERRRKEQKEQKDQEQEEDPHCLFPPPNDLRILADVPFYAGGLGNTVANNKPWILVKKREAWKWFERTFQNCLWVQNKSMKDWVHSFAQQLREKAEKDKEEEELKELQAQIKREEGKVTDSNLSSSSMNETDEEDNNEGEGEEQEQDEKAVKKNKKKRRRKKKSIDKESILPKTFASFPFELVDELLSSSNSISNSDSVVDVHSHSYSNSISKHWSCGIGSPRYLDQTDSENEQEEENLVTVHSLRRNHFEQQKKQQDSGTSKTRRKKMKQKKKEQERSSENASTATSSQDNNNNNVDETSEENTDHDEGKNDPLISVRSRINRFTWYPFPNSSKMISNLGTGWFSRKVFGNSNFSSSSFSSSSSSSSSSRGGAKNTTHHHYQQQQQHLAALGGKVPLDVDYRHYKVAYVPVCSRVVPNTTEGIFSLLGPSSISSFNNVNMSKNQLRATLKEGGLRSLSTQQLRGNCLHDLMLLDGRAPTFAHAMSRRCKDTTQLLAKKLFIAGFGHSHTRYLFAMLCMLGNHTWCGDFSNYHFHLPLYPVRSRHWWRRQQCVPQAYTKEASSKEAQEERIQEENRIKEKIKRKIEKMIEKDHKGQKQHHQQEMEKVKLNSNNNTNDDENIIEEEEEQRNNNKNFTLSKEQKEHYQRLERKMFASAFHPKRTGAGCHFKLFYTGSWYDPRQGLIRFLLNLIPVRVLRDLEWAGISPPNITVYHTSDMGFSPQSPSYERQRSLDLELALWISQIKPKLIEIPTHIVVSRGEWDMHYLSPEMESLTSSTSSFLELVHRTFPKATIILQLPQRHYNQKNFTSETNGEFLWASWFRSVCVSNERVQLIRDMNICAAYRASNSFLHHHHHHDHQNSNHDGETRQGNTSSSFSSPQNSFESKLVFFDSDTIVRSPIGVAFVDGAGHHYLDVALELMATEIRHIASSKRVQRRYSERATRYLRKNGKMHCEKLFNKTSTSKRKSTSKQGGEVEEVETATATSYAEELGFPPERGTAESSAKFSMCTCHRDRPVNKSFCEFLQTVYRTPPRDFPLFRDSEVNLVKPQQEEKSKLNF